MESINAPIDRSLSKLSQDGRRSMAQARQDNIAGAPTFYRSGGSADTFLRGYTTNEGSTENMLQASEQVKILRQRSQERLWDGNTMAFRAPSNIRRRAALPQPQPRHDDTAVQEPASQQQGLSLEERTARFLSRRRNRPEYAARMKEMEAWARQEGHLRTQRPQPRPEQAAHRSSPPHASDLPANSDALASKDVASAAESNKRNFDCAGDGEASPGQSPTAKKLRPLLPRSVTESPTEEVPEVTPSRPRMQQQALPFTHGQNAIASNSPFNSQAPASQLQPPPQVVPQANYASTIGGFPQAQSTPFLAQGSVPTSGPFPNQATPLPGQAWIPAPATAAERGVRAAYKWANISRFRHLSDYQKSSGWLHPKDLSGEELVLLSRRYDNSQLKGYINALWDRLEAAGPQDPSNVAKKIVAAVEWFGKLAGLTKDQAWAQQIQARDANKVRQTATTRGRQLNGFTSGTLVKGQTRYTRKSAITSSATPSSRGSQVGTSYSGDSSSAAFDGTITTPATTSDGSVLPSISDQEEALAPGGEVNADLSWSIPDFEQPFGDIVGQHNLEAGAGILHSNMDFVPLDGDDPSFDAVLANFSFDEFTFGGDFVPGDPNRFDAV